MKFPIVKVIKPSNLRGVTNGDLPEGLLRSVGKGGLLHVNAARAFEALRADAEMHGFALTYTWGGTYRTLQSQISLFERRYDKEFVEGRNVKTGSRTWNGVKYWKRSGVAAAATPGTSNHGWGLAIDMALDSDRSDGLDPDDAVYIGPALNYLFINAERFGFSWELQSEPWHLRYVKGDEIPQAVRDFEKGVKPEPPKPQQTSKPVLRLGSTGDGVTLLQSALRARGFTIAVDGHFGPQTDRTVRAFQSRSGLTVDGLVGDKTWSALQASAPVRQKRPTIRVGSQGDDVRYLQRVLHADGAHIIVDGMFGPQTERHVRNFQRKHGLKIDGIVGTAQTWPKINEVADTHEVAS